MKKKESMNRRVKESLNIASEKESKVRRQVTEAFKCCHHAHSDGIDNSSLTDGSGYSMDNVDIKNDE